MRARGGLIERLRRCADAAVRRPCPRFLNETIDALWPVGKGNVSQVEVPTNRITGIVNGQRAITGDTALRLGHFFGTSPVFWLNLQSLYESCAWPSRERASRSGPCPSSGAAGAGVSAGRRTHDSSARMTGPDHPTWSTSSGDCETVWSAIYGGAHSTFGVFQGRTCGWRPAGASTAFDSGDSEDTKGRRTRATTDELTGTAKAGPGTMSKPPLRQRAGQSGTALSVSHLGPVDAASVANNRSMIASAMSFVPCADEDLVDNLCLLGLPEDARKRRDVRRGHVNVSWSERQAQRRVDPQPHPIKSP